MAVVVMQNAIDNTSNMTTATCVTVSLNGCSLEQDMSAMMNIRSNYSVIDPDPGHVRGAGGCMY